MKKLILFLIIWSSCPAMAQFNSIPTFPFPQLDGPYNVATTDYFWIDFARDEIYTKDTTDRRHLQVQVWYPTIKDPGKTSSLYILNPDELGTPTQLIKDIIHVRTNSILNGAISNERDKFPIIIFSHGMGMTRFSNTFLLEYLASNGYIIFSIGHTFFNNTVVFPDGYRAERDYFPEMEQLSDSDYISTKSAIDYALETFKNDTEYVLSKISHLNKSHDNIFGGRLDLNKIGICGWSIGGINAAQMCIFNNSIKAGINYDGLAGIELILNGTDKPFLLMKSDQKMSEEFVTLENLFLKNSSNDAYRITITGTVHTNFSDMALFNSKMRGEISTKLCYNIINQITLAFFNKYIRGDQSVNLNLTSSKFQEVKFEKF